MMNHNAFEELSRRLSALLPAANTMGEELRTKIEQTLKKGFAELNLMTQDDFEAQAVTLQRAMQRIEELEALIKDLEAKLESVEQSKG